MRSSRARRRPRPAAPGTVVVQLLVALAPPADHAVRRRDHDVTDELVARDPSATAALVQPIRRSSKTSTVPTTSRGCRNAGGRVHLRRQNCIRVLLPAPLGPRITQRSSSSTDQLHLVEQGRLPPGRNTDVRRARGRRSRMGPQRRGRERMRSRSTYPRLTAPGARRASAAGESAAVAASPRGWERCATGTRVPTTWPLRSGGEAPVISCSASPRREVVELHELPTALWVARPGQVSLDHPEPCRCRAISWASAGRRRSTTQRSKRVEAGRRR